MATFIQRGQSIGNALINGVATLQQLDRLGKALAYRDARLAEYLAADNNGKAEIYVTAFRRWAMEAIKLYEAEQAVAQAKADASDQVDIDFPEAP